MCSSAVEKTVLADRSVAKVWVDALREGRRVEQVFVRLLDLIRRLNGDLVQITLAARYVYTLRRLLESHGLVSQHGFGVNVACVCLVGPVARGWIEIEPYNVLELWLDSDLGLGVGVLGHNRQQVVFGRDGSG